MLEIRTHKNVTRVYASGKLVGVIRKYAGEPALHLDDTYWWCSPYWGGHAGSVGEAVTEIRKDVADEIEEVKAAA